jgi:transposase-like protein
MKVLDLFKRRYLDREIIVLCGRWYLTYKLSSRDLVQMMAERGIEVTHTTILRWVQRFVPEFEKRSIGRPAAYPVRDLSLSSSTHR